MDQTALVEDKIADGQKLIARLNRHNFDITAAFWVKTSEEEQWFLYIGSNAVDEMGLAAAYRIVQEMLQRMPDPWISLSEIKLIGATNPITQAVLNIQSRHSSRMPTRLAGMQLAGVSIQEGYVYPRPPRIANGGQTVADAAAIWFSEFVEEAIASFRQLNEPALKEASFQEKLDTILAEQIVLPTFIGHVGERFIQTALKQKGYEAVLAGGSRSPADVWGYGRANGLCHVSLVQVKATRTDHPAETLSVDDERKLNDFALFVADMFVKSKSVPDQIKNLPLLVSAGYAGVVVDWLKMGPTHYDTRCLGAAGSKAVINAWDRWGPWLDEFYKDLRA